MLTIITGTEVLVLLVEPVDDWVGVFLDGGGENNDVVPFANLL